VGYQILQVRPDSLVGDEQMGSKTKVWFLHEGVRWLFKEARAGTGEDWAEKLGAEVAHLIGIPAAQVELAERSGKRGSASKSFLVPERDNLMHGNEVLFQNVAEYDQSKTQHQSDHTLPNVVSAISKIFAGQPALRDEVLERLCSYMLLDALIGNTDRHHENWGLIWRLDAKERRDADLTVVAAPSFDHASSLGRELTEIRRLEILENDAVAKYATSSKARGGVYLRSEDAHGANPLRLVEVASRLFPTYFAPSIDRLRNTPRMGILALVDEVPDTRMSEAAKRFAKDYMAFTYDSLVRLAT
jgi:hypothetical protein